MQLKQGATVLRTTGYAWDNADQITSQTVNGVTTNYGYDLAGQLTSEVRTGYNVAYTYDANGNRLSKTVNGTVESYTYDLADKMLTAGAKSYTYDAAGRTVGINAPGGTTTLSYDYESRVTAITGPGINETHTYNGLDTRVGTVQGGVSRTFVRDGSYVTDPVLRDGQATYTPGVSERRGAVSAWSHSGLKNADAQTTGAGSIQATRVYDAFGAELSATGTWKGPFGYAGGFGYQEDSSGLKLLGHRYYDPTTGRFLSRDPIKDGRNWYVYCDNDPISRADPTGLEWHDPTSVSVDKDFKGKVWVVGEPGPGKEQVFVQVMPGESSPPGMDVDIVIVQYPDGRQDRYFVPGANPPQDPEQVPCTYDIDSKGRVIPGPPVYREIFRGRFQGMPYDISYGIDWPVWPPKKFGPGLGGWYPGGNWNDDIEKAKKRKYK